MEPTTSVTVNIHLKDGAPGPQVLDLSAQTAPAGEAARPLAAIQFAPYPATVSLLLSSAAQADKLIAALHVAKQLLTGGQS